MKIRDVSIKTKLNVLSAASSGLALILVCAGFVLYDVTTIRQTTVDSLQSVAEVLCTNSEVALVFDDAEAAEEVLSSLARRKIVLRACIYDAEGNVFATYVRSDRSDQEAFGPRPPFAPKPYRFNANGAVELTTPIWDGESSLGALYLEASMEHLRQRLVGDVVVAAVVSVLLLGLSVLVSHKLQTVVSQPIVRLAETTEDISKRADYSIRIRKVANDEIGKLYDAFNDMVARIQERDARLREARHDLERRVVERTSQLTEANRKLNQEVIERTAAQERLETAQQQLVETARQAGMAEVATGVLHNVGNVLNSVNVSANMISRTARNGHAADLARAVDLMDQHRDDLGSFVTAHERGKHLPIFLRELSGQLTSDRDAVLSELESLTKNIEHIKEIVATQQAFAKVAGTADEVELAEVFEEALKLYGTRLSRHGIQVHRDYREVPTVITEKHRLMQILVNLISNARHALNASTQETKHLTLITDCRGDNRVVFQVCDNGIGIAQENLTRIFSHGFTTRNEGHGFGLHSSALAAKVLGGSLSAESEGPGRGAVFTLELPVSTKAESKKDAVKCSILAALTSLEATDEGIAHANARL